MPDKIKNCIKPLLWLVSILLLISCFLFDLKTPDKIIKAIGPVITISIIIFTLYCRFLWIYNPLEKTPRIMGTYKGNLHYDYDGYNTKEITITIKQQLFTVSIDTSTDESTSNSIVADIIKDNGEYTLYYTYITNPSSKVSDKNPIQYGTCRFSLKDTNNLKGVYWTSRNTKGDIELSKK